MSVPFPEDNSVAFSCVNIVTGDSFPLQAGHSHVLKPAVGLYGNIELISFFEPLVDGVATTNLEINDERGDALLQIGLWPNQNVIALSSNLPGQNPDKEIRVPFRDYLPPSKSVRIRILDRGDNYLVSFSDGNGVKCLKSESQVNKKASMIKYLVAGGRSSLSDPVKVIIHGIGEGSAHSIKPPICEGGIFQVFSSYPPNPQGVDGSRIELYDNIGNTLLHVSLRPAQNLIAINAKKLGSDWDYSKEVRTSFTDHLPPFKAAYLGAMDYGDHYVVDFSDGDAVKFPKLFELAANEGSSIRYLTAQGPPVLSKPLTIYTHSD